MRKPSYWTIQILPGGGGRARSYRVEKRRAKAAGIAAAVLLMMASAFVATVLGRQDAVEQLARYRAENRQLITSLQAMERRSGEFSQALDDLSAREQRFRLVAGLPLLDPDVYSVGVGGPGGVPAATDEFLEVAPDLAREAGDVVVDIEQLLRRADLLGSSLTEAADSVGTQRERYQRIPSIWPVASEESWISSGFSHNRLHPLLGLRRPHTGVDISADFGTPVIAAGAGRVTFAGTRGEYGRLVEIDHGDGYASRYAHLGRIAVRVGARVGRGDVLGEVGVSGTATGPNLHYEVLINGRAVNPVGYFLDGYRR
ncbi:MAG: M23 family metallopeptidase [Gemmatimonadales bacterium]|nr:M23 family metallopeptidase [Gemmatimonadales bacterium]MYG48659.1 M23 family metallopeptidase [Gemmatimonadales bacterium]MYK00995.1 M23 family metallopeptidase [Candidatus Palauibacter ramosifaciens]